jgi:hypothetical protein
MPEEFVDDIIAGAASVELPQKDTASTDNSAALADDTAVNVDDPDNSDATATDGDGTPDEDGTPDGDAAKPAPTVEELASQLGWKPDYEGDSYVDAATYILRSREIQDSMRDHNKDLKNQLSTMQSSIDALKDHNERVYKAEVSRMQGEIERLKKEKRAAVELADVDKVEELENEISSIEKNLTEPRKQQATTNPIYDEWIKENDWYLKDDEMAAYADQVAQQYAGAPLNRLYPLVRAKVAEVFPEKFEPTKPVKAVPKRNLANAGDKQSGQQKPVGPASPVERGKKSGSTPTFTKADLTPDQQTIMKQFVQSGIMTEEQYIKDIAKLQEA